MIIGYARVSTNDQTLDLQHDALNKAGCERVFDDTASGAKVDRKGLQDALNHLRKVMCSSLGVSIDWGEPSNNSSN